MKKERAMDTPKPNTSFCVHPSTFQGLARIGRLARKELAEILCDRRTILTLVLMPLLLYTLLSFAFRQFLMVFVSSADIGRELRIGVANEDQKGLAEAYLAFGAEVPCWR